MNGLLLLKASPASDLFPGPWFAHQGGWDEILLVAAPLAVIGGLLFLANRRVDQKLDQHDSDPAG